ncbi:MAG TPA: histidinol-phosphate transaminase [Algoriphagus sp.]|jgi:histidinol-phosphate aminotransferase|uniref:histidinol-phosphate transaminase n=1 Tax=unclassified Algoriphagus TaxID=2641541 RepID=UPI000C5DCBF9|nr:MULTISPECIES: histidinol-phosphate transaminase [unclassified Algoriphagus]MAL11866.1 histidinol-phosphate transaminase [Algoriphagus sp.]MAN86547.1 histidinol-phosphate transaminase [Algoriphagus sp.]QYH38713.1 histidinol-phosphate transaminase [Algoriphagus sp. NBT04N3]HAH35605.1 histidinol-phosphate transaminase [Algoriphagus sp.]HAS60614.1 histidinol-phosphate transaminase [Algoriphagus sp.]|tara:strand:+ start:14138 stop:15190 length:1053 start_codon:yes stop_codon:yes gene_type:complete
MSFDLNSLLRPHIVNLQPYTSARDEYTGKEGVFLDANENPYGSITDQDFNRYPDPYQSELKEKIAAIKDVKPSQIFLGNGSDEAIDLLFRAFCNPGVDNVILLPPTYGMYEVSASINDVAVKKVPLTADFQLQTDLIFEAINNKTKIIFVCSPNNPSGNKVKRSDVLLLLKHFKGLVVVDEAYIDFNDEPSFTNHLKDFPNLLVMQTFSKAWGLASLRLGMAFASEELIKILNRIKPPYNISGLTQETVLAAIDKQEKVESMIQKILDERDFLEKHLLEIDAVQKIHPSQANFLLVKVPAANQVYEQLIENKIIVRNRAKVQLCENCLRISVGTRDENQAFIKALKAILD